MLELINVIKKYHDRTVVNNVSFKVNPGEILGIIGANGAGKSTCAGMIATLIKPDGGQILYKGEDIQKHPAVIRRELGYVPQDIALYETLTGLDNLKFWGQSYGVARAGLQKEAERVSEIIRFNPELLNKRVNEYSGGMKRRLNIGVALMHRPKLVVLDEPTAGIDRASGIQILESIRELGQQGTAVVYIGHYMEEVEEICTHICVLNGGSCVAFGRKGDVLAERGCGSLNELYDNL